MGRTSTDEDSPRRRRATGFRSKEADRARYGWLSPRDFGDRVGLSESSVREQLIGGGWFRLLTGGVPECMDVRKPGAKNPEYRIHPKALERYYRERAIVGGS
jgi:hypothetical protein